MKNWLLNDIRQTVKNLSDPNHPGPQGRVNVCLSGLLLLSFIIVTYGSIIWAFVHPAPAPAQFSPNEAIISLADVAEGSFGLFLIFCIVAFMRTSYVDVRYVIAFAICGLAIFGNRIDTNLNILTNHFVSDPQAKDVAVYLTGSQLEVSGIGFAIGFGLLCGLVFSEWKNGPTFWTDFRRYWNDEPSPASLERWRVFEENLFQSIKSDGAKRKRPEE